MFLASTVLSKLYHVDGKISIPSAETVKVLKRLFIKPSILIYKNYLNKAKYFKFLPGLPVDSWPSFAPL